MVMMFLQSNRTITKTYCVYKKLKHDILEYTCVKYLKMMVRKDNSNLSLSDLFIMFFHVLILNKL